LVLGGQPGAAIHAAVLRRPGPAGAGGQGPVAKGGGAAGAQARNRHRVRETRLRRLVRTLRRPGWLRRAGAAAVRSHPPSTVRSPSRAPGGAPGGGRGTAPERLSDQVLRRSAAAPASRRRPWCTYRTGTARPRLLGGTHRRADGGESRGWPPAGTFAQRWASPRRAALASLAWQ